MGNYGSSYGSSYYSQGSSFDWDIVLGVLVILLILTYYIAALVMCVKMAGNRNRHKGLWFMLGFTFSWVAVLVLACLPKENLGEEIAMQMQYQQTKQQNKQTYRCGYCGTVTNQQICPGCGLQLY